MCIFRKSRNYYNIPGCLRKIQIIEFLRPPPARMWNADTADAFPEILGGSQLPIDPVAPRGPVPGQAYCDRGRSYLLFDDRPNVGRITTVDWLANARVIYFKVYILRK